jgi:DNA-binding MarR family transcriptional regulator
MNEDSGRDDQAALLRDRIGTHLRKYGAESSRISDLFAKTHAMHPTDFQALVVIVNAQAQGTPATPGTLGKALGITSGAVTGAIDRLVAAGHVTRTPDEHDRRQTRLHWQGPAMALAYEFFGPLGERTDPILARYTTAELEVIEQFLAAVADATADYRADLEAGPSHRGTVSGGGATRGE